MVDGKLVGAVLLDIGGIITSFYFGDVLDLIYAPIQTIVMIAMFQDYPLAIMGGAEELLPAPFDIIPSATITYFIKKNG